MIPQETQHVMYKYGKAVADICDFAATCNLADVAPVLRRQIALNSAIADEGLKNDYGANIGKVLLQTGSDGRTRAKARAAAASDARMNGCEMPVVICSGSGNQGITASLPVAEYAKERGKREEELLRALAVSNLVTLHAKSGIGRLSAYCGAESALWRTPLSTPLPSQATSSATARNPPVQPRSLWRWRRGSSAMRCT